MSYIDIFAVTDHCTHFFTRWSGCWSPKWNVPIAFSKRLFK